MVGRASVPRERGEADLVVGDDVQGAADVIAEEPHHVQRFRHHSLGGEGGVTVDQYGNDRVAVGL